MARWWLRGIDRADGVPAVQAGGAGAELHEAFTPTAGEIAWAREQTRTPERLLTLVVLLKSCHRLGYFPVLAEVPPPVTEHIRGVLELKPEVQARHDSDRPVTRIGTDPERHMT
jgi:Domain of unknown function (DUF4158)